MKTTRPHGVNLSGNRCRERGCVVLDQSQQLAKTWLSGLFHALRLACDTAALLSVPVAAASLLLLSPFSANAQGGVPLWTNRYDGGFSDYPNAIAVDNSGNVIVTGDSYATNEFPGNSDYVTIKYSSAGVPLWTNRYNGFANGTDDARAIAVDRNGHVFVTGSSQTSNSADYVTIAYATAGVPLWTNRYRYPGPGTSVATAIAVDGIGNVFVTGISADANGYTDFATVAYSNSGVALWTNRYSGPGNGDDRALGIVVDDTGNVFVTGNSYNGSNFDWATVKYSNTGVASWTNRFNGSIDFYSKPIALGNNGNVFVTGSSAGIHGQPDYATAGYSNSGLPLWTNRYDGPANYSDVPTAVLADSSGNVFVTGSSDDLIDSIFRSDYATIKYSNSGIPLWTNRYPGPGNNTDSAKAIAIDSGGNVFVTGLSYDNGTSDYATIAYSNTGEPLWEDRYGRAEAATAIAVDSNGNVFVTGYSSNGSNSDFVTIKYSSSPPPPVYLGFQRQNNQLVLSWTNAGFNLQSAPAVTGPFTNVPSATSPYTNSLSAPRQFFRLAQ